MKQIFGRAAGTMALVTAMTLGFGGIAEATSVPASVPVSAPASLRAVSTVSTMVSSYPRVRRIDMGGMNIFRCYAYGQYYVASGQAVAYQCLPYSPFMAFQWVWVRY
ncbi:hypothetical protein ACF1BB_30525 [Streptomyces griseoluteus]|uniref:hypothetical protein n=1 Tax=Streptomyces TaxID=1883 RepID=UPI0036F661AD